MKVISNSGPLIHLARIKQLDLLRSLYGSVIITFEVKNETVEMGKIHGHADALLIENAIESGWIKIAGIRDPSEKLSRYGLHRAEEQVIYFAVEEKADLVLLDEDAAREVARAFGIRVRGSIGVIVEATEKGIIKGSEALKLLDDLSEVMHLGLPVYRAARETIQKIGGV